MAAPSVASSSSLTDSSAPSTATFGMSSMPKGSSGMGISQHETGRCAALPAIAGTGHAEDTPPVFYGPFPQGVAEAAVVTHLPAYAAQRRSRSTPLRPTPQSSTSPSSSRARPPVPNMVSPRVAASTGGGAPSTPMSGNRLRGGGGGHRMLTSALDQRSEGGVSDGISAGLPCAGSLAGVSRASSPIAAGPDSARAGTSHKSPKAE